MSKTESLTRNASIHCLKPDYEQARWAAVFHSGVWLFLGGTPPASFGRCPPGRVLRAGSLATLSNDDFFEITPIFKKFPGYIEKLALDFTPVALPA